MTRRITDEERRARIGLLHRLAQEHRTDDVVQIAHDLVALHASDPATVFLSVAARMAHPDVAPLESALYDERTLYRLHLMRRTLWVTSAEFASYAHPSTTVRYLPKQVKRYATFIEESSIATDGYAWIDDATTAIEQTVRARGPIGTREIGQIHPDLAVSFIPGAPGANAHGRMLILLGFEGRIVRGMPEGTWVTGQYLWEAAPGGSLLDEVDPADGAARVLDRYLSRFGPATLDDITWWFGWTKGIARTAIETCGAVEVEVSSGPAFVAATDDEPHTARAPWVALLPGLDATVMGWKQRDWYIDDSLVPVLFDRNGNAGPTVWMDGRVVGGWTQRTSGEIAYRLFDDEAKARGSEVENLASRLEAFYGNIRHKPRFPAPLQKELY